MADRNTSIHRRQLKPIQYNDLDTTNLAVDGFVPAYDEVTGKFTWVSASGGGGAGSSYSTSFTDASLSTAGILVVNHSLGQNYPLIVIYDNTDKIIVPDEVENITTSQIEVDLSSYAPITGTWNIRVLIVGGGDGSLSDLDDVSFATGTPVDNDILRYNSSTEKWEAESVTIPDLSTDIDDFTIKYEAGKLKVADRIEQNIMLLAFYRASDASASIYNLVDGFVDEYQDETGVNTSESTNEEYDGVNNLYSPTVSGGAIDSNTYLLLHLNNNVTDSGEGTNSPHTVTNNSMSFTASAKWGSHAGDFDGSTSYLSAPDSSDWDIAGSNVDDLTVDFWVKHTDHAGTEYYVSQGSNDDNSWYVFHSNGNGIKLTVRDTAVNVINLGFAGEITDTDWHHVAICKVADEWGLYKDGTQIAYTQDSSTANFTGLLKIASQPSGASYFDGYMDEFRIQHSNYFSATPVVGLSDTITLPTGEYNGGTSDNMTLISESVVAEASPSTARIVIFEEDVDSITLNTDLKAYVTRENGTGATWEQVTLVDEGNYSGNKRILSATIDLDVTGMASGTDIAYKIETLNSKDLDIHGVAVNWD